MIEKVRITQLSPNIVRFMFEGQEWETYTAGLRREYAGGVELVVVRGDRFGTNRLIGPPKLWENGTVTRTLYIQTFAFNRPQMWYPSVDCYLVQTMQQKDAKQQEWKQKCEQLFVDNRSKEGWEGPPFYERYWFPLGPEPGQDETVGTQRPLTGKAV